MTKYEKRDTFQYASVIDPGLKLNWRIRSESRVLRAAILAKTAHVSSDLGPQIVVEQPPSKKLRDSSLRSLWFIYLAHDAIPGCMQVETDGYLKTAYLTQTRSASGNPMLKSIHH